MRNTTAKNRVEREEKKLTGSSNLPFKTFYKFNEAPFWIFCWPDRMLWGSNFKVVTWPKKRSERGKIYNYWWHDTFLTTLTLGWVTLTQSWSWGKKKSTPNPWYNNGIRAKITGQRRRQHLLAFLCLWIHSFLQFSLCSKASLLKISGSENNEV